MARTLDEALAMAKGPYSRLALYYSFVMKDLVKKGKEPGFGVSDWAPLAAYVATDEFERIGNFREKVNWAQYEELLTMWAKATDWEFNVRRVTEGDHYALLELEESASSPGRLENYTSVSVYDFNEADKLSHLEIYLSRADSPSAAHSWDWEEVEAEIV